MTVTGDVKVEVNYIGIADRSIQPYTYTKDPPPGTPRTNWTYEPHTVLVRDVRGTKLETGASLDVQGFQWLKGTFTDISFEDEEEIERVFHKEVEAWLLSVIPGAKQVFTLNCNVRGIENNPNALNKASLLAHCDKTLETSRTMLVDKFGAEEAARLSKSRVRLINFWRPLKEPVARNPLAVMDWRTLNFKDASEGGDLNIVRRIRPTYENYNLNISYNPGHEWYYMSGQAPDDVLLFKCYDSLEDGTALSTAHSSFDHEKFQGLPTRKSVDMRFFVLDSE
ncbi:hypothetical protein C8J56DRAFT_213735 [Mycena floridula]|nr:hypothetical protein C8J56DRAFT_213735 [Mycena floridula]